MIAAKKIGDKVNSLFEIRPIGTAGTIDGVDAGFELFE